MGWGDELIVTGQVRKLHAETRKKIVVYDRTGAIRDHALWAGNPKIATRSDRINPLDYGVLTSGPHVRPYILSKSDSLWQWKDFKPTPGEIYFTDAEKQFADQFSPDIIIEPNVKQKASPNKDWGRQRWQTLADVLRGKGHKVYQLGSDGIQLLQGVKHLRTATFREACAVLARAKAAVLPEGGLHHAAAAVGVRSVVIYGGFISPAQTGYDLHHNLFTGGKPCGSRQPCRHCHNALASITPDTVLAGLEAIL